MIAARAGTKRARPEDAAKPTTLWMEAGGGGDGDGDVLMEELPTADNQREGDGDEDHARRKRAMRVRADLRFLEKLPPLRAYQRGRFGRRGGVDGGAPQDAASPWMRALERSLEETSFVTGEAPARAAIVAPLAVGGASRGVGIAPRPLPPQVLMTHALPTPVTPAPTPVHRTLPPHAAIDMRGAFAGFVAVAPRTPRTRAVAVAGGGKDDEARSADW